VPASVGFIALIGIAVLNGVVLVSYINEVVARGDLGFRAAVLEGAKRRLRPVTLTATIAALGLVPFLFATGPGAEIQRPLAVVVIGGLVTATLLTLVLLPILYDRFGLSKAEKADVDARAPAIVPSDQHHSGLPVEPAVTPSPGETSRRVALLLALMPSAMLVSPPRKGRDGRYTDD
jgi:cobalt-zinc-cadmium resistance protein CzcA